ncbi:MAG: glycosyltransferase family 2 protein [Nitrospiraceae bacterium]|nr:glycosyltransferase family 2 protein [Nitrospiraceae bacterium]
MTGRISVIIPTLEAAGGIGGLIAAVRAQTFEAAEIIVVDSSSTDGTARMARELGARVEVIPREKFDHGGTRTLAAKMAVGEILVFLTQDALPADDRSLENLVEPLREDKGIAASYGRQLPNPDATPLAAHLRLFNYGQRSYKKSLADKAGFGIKTVFLSDSFAAYRRSALEAVGWFGQNLICSEDSHAGAKLVLAGHRLAYAADAAVYHSHNYGALQEARRYFDTGVFHGRERWILKEFGGAGAEGKRFVGSGLRYLADNGRLRLAPEFLFRTALKYVFYSLGKNYRYLPRFVIRRLGNNRRWWDKTVA